MKTILQQPSLQPFKILHAVFLFAVLLCPAKIGYAGSATWAANPGSGDWNTATNWSPNTVPNGSLDTATFANSSTTTVSLSALTEVNGITFSAGASVFTIKADTPTYPATALTISGVGVTNNSGVTQTILATYDPTLNSSGSMVFKNNAHAGTSMTYTVDGGDIGFASLLTFFNSSSADHATFMINGFTFAAFEDTSTADHSTLIVNGEDPNSSNLGPGELDFVGSASGANATITGNGGTARNLEGGLIDFNGGTTAGNAIVTANGGTNRGGGAQINFFGTGTASNATVIANTGTTGGTAGMIFFKTDATGGTSRIEVFGKGELDVSSHNSPGVTVGSIEGSGPIFLGARNLTVGSNNLTTTYSGVIQDGGVGGGAGGTRRSAPAR